MNWVNYIGLAMIILPVVFMFGYAMSDDWKGGLKLLGVVIYTTIAALLAFGYGG